MPYTTTEAIFELFKQKADQIMTPSMVAEELKILNNTATGICNRLALEGKIIKVERGKYVYPHEGTEDSFLDLKLERHLRKIKAILGNNIDETKIKSELKTYLDEGIDLRKGVRNIILKYEDQIEKIVVGHGVDDLWSKVRKDPIQILEQDFNQIKQLKEYMTNYLKTNPTALNNTELNTIKNIVDNFEERLVTQQIEETIFKDVMKLKEIFKNTILLLFENEMKEQLLSSAEFDKDLTIFLVKVIEETIHLPHKFSTDNIYRVIARIERAVSRK